MFENRNPIRGSFQGQYTQEENENYKLAFETLTNKFVDAMNANLDVSSKEVQELVAEHYEFISQFWKPNKSAYKELGQMYILPTEYRETYESFAPGLSQFHYEAMLIWADLNLEN